MPQKPAPRVEEFDLPLPRVTPPATLAACFSASPLDRLNHSAGKIYADCARKWLRRPPSAPYFTLATRVGDGSVASALAAWREIKLAANEAVVAHDGTITHHHALGRDHRNSYEPKWTRSSGRCWRPQSRWPNRKAFSIRAC